MNLDRDEMMAACKRVIEGYNTAAIRDGHPERLIRWEDLSEAWQDFMSGCVVAALMGRNGAGL